MLRFVIPGMPGRSPPGVSTPKMAGKPEERIEAGIMGEGEVGSKDEEGNAPDW
jgi:hypothetical protein